MKNDIELNGETCSWINEDNGKQYLVTSIGSYIHKGGGLSFRKQGDRAVEFIPHRGGEENIENAIIRHYNDNNKSQ